MPDRRPACTLAGHARGHRCSPLPVPPFPPSPTGHSQTAGAAAGVLIAALGDDTPFTIGTEAAGLQPRTFASFTQVRCACCDRAALHLVHATPRRPAAALASTRRRAPHPPPRRRPTRPPSQPPPPQAVEEVNDSRVLGGVHFRKSVEDGARLGRQVAAYVYDRLDGAGQYVAAEA